MTTFAEIASMTKALREKRGNLVGIACKNGKFAVTETIRAGRSTVTRHLTNWQSHAECVAHMRNMIEGA
jgi:hypothetical protein